ncbi:MAG: DUF370 domain-containing protein [Anaerolineales bacterium]|nr:DUF370 domain-containing protein [Anaerolineales bacterium]
MNWLTLGGQGLVAANRIVAVGAIDAAPIRRLLEQIPAGQIIILTGGRRRQTALVLDSGHIILTPWSIRQVENALARLAAATDPGAEEI